MKKLGLIKGLSVFACLGVVAGGFAAWQFSKDANAADALGIQIAEASETGNVAITANGTLLLDQTGMTFQSFDVKATYTGGSNSEEGTAGEIERTYIVTLSEALDKYISISEYGSGTWEDGTTIATPTFVWDAGMNPDNITEYNEMVSALDDAEITFTFNADWTDSDSIA